MKQMLPGVTKNDSHWFISTISTLVQFILSKKKIKIITQKI